MISRAGRSAAAVLLLAAPLPAAAQVSVAFIDPERYTDAGNRVGSGPPQRVVRGEMRRLFTQLGDRVLRPGESFTISVLDIDLAGFDQPGGNMPYGLRVVTDITPPRFRLRYALKARGRVVLSAQETVTDINFLVRYARSAGAGSFFYERELIRDWLQSRIAARRPPSGRVGGRTA